MVNRLEIVQRFVEEQRLARPELVAAFLTGSVARGEDQEVSDCDLTFLVAEPVVPEALGASAEWREGVYLDVFVTTPQAYNDVERVLASAFAATHMKDALILYDPTGVVTQVQQEVRAVYMQPVHLRKRLDFCLDWLRKDISQAPAALADDDAIALCRAVGFLPMTVASLWLLRAGITPSSTRTMIQLGAVDSELKARLLNFMGASALDTTAVDALIPLSQAAMDLDEVHKGLTFYFVKKGAWMAQNGFHQEALLPLWHPISFIAGNCVATPALIPQVAQLIQAWLNAVGWHGQATWAAKVQSAQSFLAEAEAMVAAD